MARVVARIGIVGVDHVADLAGERPALRLAHRLLLEGREPSLAQQEAGGDAIRRREFGGVAVGRRMLERQRLPEPVHRAFADLADQRDDLLRRDAHGSQLAGAIDIGLRHGSAGVGLEGEIGAHPAVAEPFGEPAEVRRLRGREGLVEAMRSFEHRRRACEARARQRRRADSGLSRKAGMQPLRGGAVREIFDDARSHGARDAERPRGFFWRHPERRGDGGRRAHGAQHGGRVEARLVDRLRRDGAPRHITSTPTAMAAIAEAPPSPSFRPRPARPAPQGRRHGPARPRTCRRNPRHGPPCR